jgi:hypothetical protein
MSDFVYTKALEAFADKLLDWDTDNTKVVLCTSGYVEVQATDQYLSDIAAGYRVATSGNLSGKSLTNGVCDASDVTITAVAGSAVTHLAVYQDSGSPATSRLLAHIDSYAGLPFTPNGGDVTITWPNDANKIFKI